MMALPRYVNLSTSSRSSPFNLILSCFLLLAGMTGFLFAYLEASVLCDQRQVLAVVAVSEEGGRYHLNNPGRAAELLVSTACLSYPYLQAFS